MTARAIPFVIGFAISIALLQPAYAGQCPQSRDRHDKCAMTWSEKYGQCIIADYQACTGEKPQQFSLARMAPALAELERRNRLPKNILWSTAMIESKGNPHAKGKQGEIGLFQIMPSTARQWKINPHDPDDAAEGVARMYSSYIRKYGVSKAITAYNCGPGCVERNHEPASTKQYKAKLRYYLASGG